MRVLATSGASGVEGVSAVVPVTVEPEAMRRILEATVAAVFHLPVAELDAPTRRRAPVAFGRQVAMYIAHVGIGLSLTEVGRLFGRDRTTAAHACRLIEERRDDPDLDGRLAMIEAMIGAWRSGLAALERGT
ncbi:dnaA protein helix-turn-helix [Pseudoxanthobacter soli DSM 19599]|uniref:DnaA protein helix-turn-helix n=1 Tax=Pseudoxanthobacter soli DSM 19599 TaxID=1123029 RepID=A0A1M7ZMV5_9HYPH|nr:helix-turn-helix domain-containing protein [Pseudoxanthobacter soli]SHO66211.1 dnaA protein helix-turn-helix [Pseudoxanthobacter soli DSM 19599]